MKFREKAKLPIFIAKGISTFLPRPISHFLPQHQHQFRGTGQRKESDPKEIARAYYSVWMRFLVFRYKYDKNIPASVAEIGPGDSMTVGMLALLCGADKYVTLDIVPTATNFNNLKVLEELIVLLKNREPIPDQVEQPKQRPYLDSYEFPSHILTDELLETTMSEGRLEKIRNAVSKIVTNETQDRETDKIQISISVPWTDPKNIELYKNSIDLIVTNAAMEHVDDVPSTYKNAYTVLKPGGLMLSAIDYKCHDSAGLWNGHWTYNKILWKIIYGNCVYFINRYSHSMHIEASEKFFETLADVSYASRENKLNMSDITNYFSKQITSEDIETTEGILLSKKVR